MKFKDENTKEDIAREMRVTPLSVQRWITDGKLNATKKVVDGTKKWIITKNDINNYLERVK